MVTRWQREAAAWAFVAAMALFSKSVYDARRRAEGREQVERAARVALTDSLSRSRAELLKAYRVDTVQFWRTMRLTDTLIKTLLKSDTITLTQRESVLVFAADSLVQQCRSVVNLCEQRLTLADSLLHLTALDRDYYRRKANGSRLTALSTAVKWAAVGYGIRLVLSR